MAATGSVGLAQRLRHHVEQAISGGVFKNLNIVDCTTNISKRFLTDLTNSLHPNHPQLGIQFGALLATCIKGVPCLVEYATTNFQPEVKKDKMFFVSMGSGQVLADPFLAFVARVLWRGVAPSVDEAKFGVYWALNHTIKLAPGGVGAPIKIATLKSNTGIWLATETEVGQEQEEYIDELEDYIGRFTKRSGNDVVSESPPILSPQ